MSCLSRALLLILLAVHLDAVAKINTGSSGVAIHGFDAVAYFLEGRAVRGKSEFEHEWQDATWQFSSAANRDLFAANSERYAPQYGGFCAVCLAIDGELLDANPKAWTIVDGKLYLNYSMHQRTRWRMRADVYVKLGDEAWSEVVRREREPASSEDAFKFAVIPPYAPGSDTRQLLLGGEIFKSILGNPWLSVTHADEPDDPSALNYLNRGGEWPYPSTNVPRKEAWLNPKKKTTAALEGRPNVERLYQAGVDLEVDAVLMWQYKTEVWLKPEWPVEILVIDMEKQRIYSHRGTNKNVDAIVRQVLEDFRTGRDGTESPS